MRSLSLALCRLVWPAILAICVTMAGFLLLHRPPQPEALRPFLTSDATCEELESMGCVSGAIERYLVTSSRGTARAWVFPDGSVFWCENSAAPFTLCLSGYSREKAWQLKDGEARSPVLVCADDGSVLIQPPLAREPGEQDGTNYRACEEENGAFQYKDGTLTIAFNGRCADWWAYSTPGSMVAADGLEWTLRCSLEKFGDQHRLTTDGYYMATPSDYTPSGPGCYFRLSAAHITYKLALFSDSHHGLQLATAMLDLQREHYNDLGYIPTMAQSGWLMRDYGIGAGFFDTRYNTDLALAMLAVGERLGVQEFTDCALDFAAYLTTHAERHSFSTGEGWLVSDYAHEDGSPLTHVSLNHQLAEINFLLRTGQIMAVETGRRMLRGIEETAAQWITPEGDLYYSHHPDGTFSGADYPYLTYNDLLNLNRYLGGNEALEHMLRAKKLWMDQNGVYGYNP